jgi:transposase-like protein
MQMGVRIERGDPRSLDAIVAAVAIEHGVAVPDLLSKRRHAALVQARAEIARQALREGVANLSQVARHLDRAPSTLSGLLLSRR